MRSISVSSTTRYFMAKIVFVYRPIATVSWKLWRASCVGQLVKKPARQPQPQPQPQPHTQHHSQFQIPGLIERLNGGSALNLPFLWGASSEIENSGPRTFLAWITLWTTPPTRTHSSASKLSYTNRGERQGRHQERASWSALNHFPEAALSRPCLFSIFTHATNLSTKRTCPASLYSSSSSSSCLPQLICFYVCWVGKLLSALYTYLLIVMICANAVKCHLTFVNFGPEQTRPGWASWLWFDLSTLHTSSWW